MECESLSEGLRAFWKDITKRFCCSFSPALMPSLAPLHSLSLNRNLLFLNIPLFHSFTP